MIVLLYCDSIIVFTSSSFSFDRDASTNSDAPARATSKASDLPIPYE